MRCKGSARKSDEHRRIVHRTALKEEDATSLSRNLAVSQARLGKAALDVRHISTGLHQVHTATQTTKYCPAQALFTHNPPPDESVSAPQPYQSDYNLLQHSFRRTRAPGASPQASRAPARAVSRSCRTGPAPAGRLLAGSHPSPPPAVQPRIHTRQPCHESQWTADARADASTAACTGAAGARTCLRWPRKQARAQTFPRELKSQCMPTSFDSTAGQPQHDMRDRRHRAHWQLFTITQKGITLRCSSVQCSRMRCMMRQPKGWLDRGTTHVRKLSMSAVMRSVGMHSITCQDREAMGTHQLDE